MLLLLVDEKVYQTCYLSTTSAILPGMQVFLLFAISILHDIVNVSIYHWRQRVILFAVKMIVKSVVTCLCFIPVKFG